MCSVVQDNPGRKGWCYRETTCSKIAQDCVGQKGFRKKSGSYAKLPLLYIYLLKLFEAFGLLPVDRERFGPTDHLADLIGGCVPEQIHQ